MRRPGTSGEARDRARRARARRLAGFSYVEVLLATVILAVALVPALEALESGIRSGGVHEREATRHYHVLAKLEEVLAQPFLDLAAEEIAAAGNPTSYSDAPGSSDRRLVFLSGYDADGVAGFDPGVLRVRVEIEATAHVLESLTTL